jgi:DNA-binding NarL/FixJ family response regulator
MDFHDRPSQGRGLGRRCTVPDMGEQGIRDLDSKRRHPRKLTDAEWEQIANEVLTKDEQQVRGFLAKGLRMKEIATELHLSDNAVLLHVQSILAKLGHATGGLTPPDPPPRRPAASAALAIPIHEPENARSHFGRRIPPPPGDS